MNTYWYKYFIFNLSMLIFSSAMSMSVVACKKSKKHKSKSENCDPECQEKKRLAEQQAAGPSNGNVPAGITINNQPPNSVIQMTGNGTADIRGFAPNLVVGLLKGHQSKIYLQGSTTLITDGLGVGEYPITILGRDVQKCVSANGQNCQIVPDEMGRFSKYAQLPVDAQWDQMADFRIQVTGPGNGPQTGGMFGSSIQMPGNNQNPNNNFFGTFWNNMKSGGTWFWNWFNNVFKKQNP